MSFMHGTYEEVLSPECFPMAPLFRPATRCQECLFEAWERMTYGGLHVSINEDPLLRSPWGIDRFREPTPPGGLILRSWDDEDNGR